MENPTNAAHSEQSDNDESTPENFMSHIALSLSGGGIRATGFHLGTLDCLDRLGLLKNVSIVSSVSGGSLVASSYAVSQFQGKPFTECFENFYNFLPTLNTVEEIFSSLTSDKDSYPSTQRNMITALANVLHDSYFAKYYDSANFGVLWNTEHSPKLSEVIINATEFKTGTAFRFQKSATGGKIGNGLINITQEQAKQIRMADVMAASACVPVGMEPLFFPQDFHWPDDDQPGRPTCTELSEHIKDVTKQGNGTIALMDGGIYDNQGITSILLALQRIDNKAEQSAREKNIELGNEENWASQHSELLKTLKPLDLFIVSDTPVKPPTFYPKDEPDFSIKNMGVLGRLTLGQYNLVAWGLTILLFLSAGENLVDLFANRASTNEWLSDVLVVDLLGFLFPTIVCGSLVGLIIWVRKKLKSLEKDIFETMPKFESSLWSYIKKIRMQDILTMLQLRTGSTIALTSKIYMRRIRQLGYSTLYSSNKLENNIREIVMTNEIYTFIDTHYLTPDLPTPTCQMKEIIGKAAKLKTQLWINPEVSYKEHGELDILVSAGQMTTCFNLMRHLQKRFGGQETDFAEGTQEAKLYGELKAMWQEFELDPLCLVKKRKSEFCNTADQPNS